MSSKEASGTSGATIGVVIGCAASATFADLLILKGNDISLLCLNQDNRILCDAIKKKNSTVVMSSMVKDFDSADAFVKSLAKPRKLFLFEYGKSDWDRKTIASAIELLSSSDIVIDGSGEHQHERFVEQVDKLAEKNVNLLDFMLLSIPVAISNSNSNSNSSSSMHTKVGDKNGQQASDKLMYGIFISGSKGAFNILEPLLTEIVALPEDMEEIEPYIFFVDSSGAAAYMRTLLGAIESAQLEALREICRSLQKVGTVTTVELMAVFTVWITNKDHYCHVLEEICRVINEAPAGSCMEAIFDGLQNSEDVPLFLKHTLSYGQGLNCELPTVSATRDALHNNGRHAEFSSYRTASLSFQGPHIENWQLIEDCMNAFSAASTILYAQCFHLLRSASAMHEWHVPMGELLRLTAVMSRVRSQPLERVYAAYCNEESSSSLPSILFDSNIHTVLSFQLMGYRRVVTVLVAAGLPCPVLSSALTGYHDTLMYKR